MLHKIFYRLVGTHLDVKVCIESKNLKVEYKQGKGGFRKMLNMLREIDRFERELLEPFLHFGFGSRGSFSNTKSDVVSDETGYSVYSAIPGIDIKDVDIVYYGGILRIEGNRKAVVEDDSGWTLVQSEIEGGRFKREFRFSETIDQEGINASYSEGILKVYLPKAKKSQPIKIEAN